MTVDDLAESDRQVDALQSTARTRSVQNRRARGSQNCKSVSQTRSQYHDVVGCSTRPRAAARFMLSLIVHKKELGPETAQAAAFCLSNVPPQWDYLSFASAGSVDDVVGLPGSLSLPHRAIEHLLPKTVWLRTSLTPACSSMHSLLNKRTTEQHWPSNGDSIRKACNNGQGLSQPPAPLLGVLRTLMMLTTGWGTSETNARQFIAPVYYFT